jgi:hypothetical protein
MKRDHSEWWVDQDGRRWSALALWRADGPRRVAADDAAGVRVYDRPDGDPLHLVRVPSPTPADGRAGRALLTDDERTALGDDPAVRDRVRWRVAVGLPRDLAALREADPALYETVRAAVAEAGPADDHGPGSTGTVVSTGGGAAER